MGALTALYPCYSGGDMQVYTVGLDAAVKVWTVCLLPPAKEGEAKGAVTEYAAIDASRFVNELHQVVCSSTPDVGAAW